MNEREIRNWTYNSRTREVIFRGKRLDNGEWAYGCQIDTDTILERHSPFRNDSKSQGLGEVMIDHDTLTQYAGYVDWNGKRAYEGDIVKNENGDVFLIVWYEKGFKFLRITRRNSWDRAFNEVDPDANVIGNIYDNAELLKD